MEQTSVTRDSSSTFSVQGFYGRQRRSRNSDRLCQRLSHVEDCVRHMGLHPPPREFCPRLLGPPATWRVFPRQAQALEFVHLQGQGLMVFSFEGEAVGVGGCRKFVATHPKQMWQRQIERRSDQRCSYEIIQDGAVCKLYFDLEFPCAHNPQSNGAAMTDTLIAVVCHFLQQEFNLECTRRNVLDLCSSSDTKFSRHLIFNILNAAFADNIHVGNFIAMVCKKIKDLDEGREQVYIPGIELNDIKQLFVLDSKNNRVLFCDEGVYTKNRNFRLYFSTKHGKHTPLVVAQDNKYCPTLHSGTSEEEQIFLDSLITLVDDNCTILTYGEAAPRAKRPRSDGKFSQSPGFELECRGQSPYPEVDCFIEEVVSPGHVRTWYYFSHTALIVYEIAQHRYCYNIGRQHRSNGILYVVDLRAATYYQKCHDPDCKGFKSPPRTLPDHVAFWRNLSQEMDNSGTIDRDEWNDEQVMSGIERKREEQLMHEMETVENNIDEDWLMSEAERLSGVTDKQLMDAVKNHEFHEVWDNLGCSSCSSVSLLGSRESQSSSQFNSQYSSQRSSSSNPWDRLSLLSSPSPLFQNSETTIKLFSSQTRADSSEFFSEETNGDDELMAAVAAVERQGDWEIEWVR